MNVCESKSLICSAMFNLELAKFWTLGIPEQISFSPASSSTCCLFLKTRFRKKYNQNLWCVLQNCFYKQSSSSIPWIVITTSIAWEVMCRFWLIDMQILDSWLLWLICFSFSSGSRWDCTWRSASWSCTTRSSSNAQSYGQATRSRSWDTHQ